MPIAGITTHEHRLGEEAGAVHGCRSRTCCCATIELPTGINMIVSVKLVRSRTHRSRTERDLIRAIIVSFVRMLPAHGAASLITPMLDGGRQFRLASGDSRVSAHLQAVC